MKPLLGFTAELNEMSGSAQPQTPPAQRSANFGSNPISHGFPAGQADLSQDPERLAEFTFAAAEP